LLVHKLLIPISLPVFRFNFCLLPAHSGETIVNSKVIDPSEKRQTREKKIVQRTWKPRQNPLSLERIRSIQRKESVGKLLQAPLVNSLQAGPDSYREANCTQIAD
jgi:hypothetical protein